MVRRRKVIWSQLASTQLREILSYWKKRNKSSTYSRKLDKQTYELTRLIGKNPKSFASTNYPNVKVAPLENYAIVYYIARTEIVIIAFRDNRQDPDKLKEIIERNT